MKKKKDKKSSLGLIIQIVFGALLGFTIGYLGLDNAINNKLSGIQGNPFIFFFCLIAIFIITMYIQIIIHEGGHYIFGKLTGYKFTSFRVGSLTFIKEEEKIKIKKFKIVGTGGQCLLDPPEYNEENFPYIWYNLGGGLLNILTALLAIVLKQSIEGNTYISIFLDGIFLFGILLGLSNLIPLRVGGVANDGYNIISLRKDKNAKYAFYVQLKVNALLTEGKRIKDIEEELIITPKDLDFNNPLICARLCVEANYYHDKGNFKKAEEICNYILNNAEGLLDLHKKEIQCELIFYSIIDGKDKEEINKLYTNELKKYIKAKKYSVNKERLLYAYELLVNKDDKEADKHLNSFNKLENSYPYKGEVENEKELIKRIKELSI